MVKGRSFIDKKLHILLFVIPLYFTQGGLFPRGSVISVLCVLIWLLLDAYYLLKTISSRKLLLFEKSIIGFGIVSFFSYLISPKLIDNGFEVFSTYGEFKNILIMMFSYFPFRYALDQQLLSQKYLNRYTILIFSAYIIAYFVKQYEALTTMYWKDNITNNGGYLIPLCFPLIGFFLGKRKSFLFAGISVILVLVSAKRGAILCLFFELLIYFWFTLFADNSSKKIKFKQIFIVLLAVLALSIVTYKVYLSNDYLIERFIDTKSGDSSGRDSIYQEALEAFQNGSLFEQMFGHGFLQTLAITSRYAHSDWYESLVDYGILGVVIYSLIFIGLYFWYKKNRKKLLPSYKFMFVSASGCWLLKSIFSMGYNSAEAAMLSIAIAISMSSVYIKHNISNAKS